VATLDDLKATPGLYVRCPNCEESFAARKAGLFDSRRPLPAQALKHIAAEREAIAEERQELQQERADLIRRSFTSTASSGVGQLLEMLAASLPGLPVDARDCRVLLKPIDYIAFSGASTGRVSCIRFIEVKTGARRLSSIQRSVQQAIESGAVRLRIADHRIPAEHP
jgi:predicted Holliday junction resolvase-like endonuclease